MQIKTFRIGLYDAERIEAEINLFLRSHRILRVESRFVESDGGTWSLLEERGADACVSLRLKAEPLSNPQYRLSVRA